MSTRKASSMDAHVGAKLREARVIGGLSQEQLGESAGITFQQIQKYERGLNRISAVRLYQFAKTLGLDVMYFYDGMEESSEDGAMLPANKGGIQEESDTLIKAYSKIKDPSTRKTILAMIKSVPKDS